MPFGFNRRPFEDDFVPQQKQTGWTPSSSIFAPGPRMPSPGPKMPNSLPSPKTPPGSPSIPPRQTVMMGDLHKPKPIDNKPATLSPFIANLYNTTRQMSDDDRLEYFKTERGKMVERMSRFDYALARGRTLTPAQAQMYQTMRDNLKQLDQYVQDPDYASNVQGQMNFDYQENLTPEQLARINDFYRIRLNYQDNRAANNQLT